MTKLIFGLAVVVLFATLIAPVISQRLEARQRAEIRRVSQVRFLVDQEMFIDGVTDPPVRRDLFESKRRFYLAVLAHDY